MKKIIIYLLWSMLFASSYAQSNPDNMKGLNNILTLNTPDVIPEKFPDVGVGVE